ncbi:helix-turn-helix domain-containing protein [Streptomyces sp. NPDC001552]|uniref:helix-turn-helix domain-containing protein n=1 Tax=Streptomyces sp. NPDC001552 TaxID=3364587 RepID=UPI003683C3AF
MRVRLRTDVLKKRATAREDNTLQAIANRIGVEESTITRLFNGESEPRLATVLKLHDAYGVPVALLIRREEVPA